MRQNESAETAVLSLTIVWLRFGFAALFRISDFGRGGGHVRALVPGASHDPLH